MLDEYKLIAEFLIDKFKKELIAQGHNNTGKLLNSFRYEVTKDSIKIYAAHYSEAMENGIPQGTWVPVGALMKWIQQRGIATGNKEIKAAAFAIRHSIYKQGSPTAGAFKFTSNGRRTGFAEVVVNEYSKLVFDMILKALKGQVFAVLSNQLKK